MTATRQLWLATGLLMALLFFCATALNTFWAKENLIRDLAAQTRADTTTLAAADIGTTLPNQIPIERYAHIQVALFDGTVKAAASESATPTVPIWFSRVVGIETPIAQADIVREGRTVGVVTTEANVAPVVSSLWQLALQSTGIFGAAALIMGLLGSSILQRILRSASRVVEHAETLTGGNYANADYSTCREFKPARAALNNLGESVQQLLKRRTAAPRPAPETRDQLTGLANRTALQEALKAELRRTDEGTPASLCIINLNDLPALNREFGRAAVDAALRQIANGLEALCRQFNDWQAARIRGAEFAILACHGADPKTVADEARAVVMSALREHAMADAVKLPIATTPVVRGESAIATLARLDGVLAAGISAQTSQTHVVSEHDLNMRPVADQLAHWRHVFEQSFTDLAFSLETFPVNGLEGELLHLESPIRLERDGERLPAQAFLPWIHCLELAPALDERVIELALAHIREYGEPLSIHLSAAALSDPQFLVWLGEQFSANESLARRVRIEFSEEIALHHTVALAAFCHRVRELGAQVGIEHAGHRLAHLHRLQGVELDYLKIDGLFIQGIDQNPGNQTLVHALCMLCKELELTPIAEGVTSDAEQETLARLGISGVTGPGVKSPKMAA